MFAERFDFDHDGISGSEFDVESCIQPGPPVLMYHFQHSFS